jgi:hypothetical protein
MKGVHGGDASGAWGGYIPITRAIYRAKQINGAKDQGGMGGRVGGVGGDASPPSPPVATPLARRLVYFKNKLITNLKIIIHLDSTVFIRS